MSTSKVLLPSAGRVTESLRSFGYNFNEAVCDIVDNSIAANSTVIKIHFNRNVLDEIEFRILDNGHGIDGQSDLEQALTLGSEKKNTAFNKFGLGLKTASTSLCRRLEVISKSTNGNILKGVYDLDIIEKTNTFTYDFPSEIPVEDKTLLTDYKSGTLIVLKNFDKLSIGKTKKSLDKKIESLSHYLSMTFQRFLDDTIPTTHNIKIFLNDEEIKPWDPFLIDNENTEKVISEEIPKEEGSKNFISFRGYSVPRYNHFQDRAEAEISRVKKPEFQGFYIYREDRLVMHGTWLNLYSREPHQNLCRIGIYFDRNFDDVFLSDVKKSEFKIVDEELMEHLQQCTAPVRSNAEKKYRDGRKKIINDDSKNAHKSSHNLINNKENELNKFSDVSFNEKTKETSFTNEFGKQITKYKFEIPKNENQFHIDPVESLEDGILFEPKFVKNEDPSKPSSVCAMLNSSHDFYRKVIYKNYKNENIINSFDALIWSFCNAELKTYSDPAKENYKELRYQISRDLKKLVEDFPEPKIEEDEGAA